ncbi:MAG: cupredoxin domain-containing protein [Bauldia sp.]
MRGPLAAAPILVAAMTGSTAGMAATVVVTVKDLAFAPARVAAKVGDTVEWRNADFLDHTATATDGTFDVVIPAGKNASWVVSRPGPYNYLCTYHPNMTGVIAAE